MSVENKIDILLREQFSPEHLVVRNDSHMHKNHTSSPGTGESHFKVTIVSRAFENKTRVQRHQMVYACLKDLMNNPIHALAINAKSPGEAPETN